ncbi:DUF4190 domain-containing protein [Microbacterium sp. NPDC058389]|uniref:DUF4190 domain-containing protein n=1 Tax=Microbacterium sp. NPDC058389 TaxID=3346475 RepID=UPI00364DB01D
MTSQPPGPQYPAQPTYPAQPQYSAQPQYATLPPAQPPYPAPVQKTTSGLSITAFVLAFLVAPVGLVLGIVALIVDARRPDRTKGLSIAAIGVAIVLVAIAVVLLVIWILGSLIADVACGELAGGCPNRGPFF